MGCGGSKGAVAPEAAPECEKQTKRPDSSATDPAGPDPVFEIVKGPAADAIAAAAAKATDPSLLVESCYATPRDTAAADPAATAIAATSSSWAAKGHHAAPDPEFDYGGNSQGGVGPLAAPAGSRAAAAPPPAAVVGGLLSRQPDWLSEHPSSANHSHHLAAVALFSNSVSGATAATGTTGDGPAAVTTTSSSSSNPADPGAQGSNGRLGMGSTSSSRLPASLPPIVGSRSSLPAIGSLPPLTFNAGQQVAAAAARPTSADGSAVSSRPPELPAPRRFTANNVEGTATSSSQQQGSRRGATERTPSSRDGAYLLGGPAQPPPPPPQQQPDDDGKPADGAAPRLSNGHNRHSRGSSSARESLADHPSSPRPAAADEVLEAPRGGSNTDDPWSALKSQYTAVAGSPDASLAGAVAHSIAKPAAAAGDGVAAAPGGARRVTAQQAAAADELVLDEGEEEQEEEVVQEGDARALPPAAGESSIGSQHSSSRAWSGRAAAAAARSGGWGAGNLAAAGTLMLGDEPSSSSAAAAESVAAGARGRHPHTIGGIDESDDDDSVFGDDDGRSTAAAGHAPQQHTLRHLSAEASSASSGAIRPQPHMPATHGAVDELAVVEDIGDDDEGGGDAAQVAHGALAGELAAKLAQFEQAMAEDDEDDED